LILIGYAETQPPFSHQLNNNMTPLAKKRPLEEKEMEYVFAKPVSVAPTPSRKTKRQSPGILICNLFENWYFYFSKFMYYRPFQTLSVSFNG
jgi:hypothetical protein